MNNSIQCSIESSTTKMELNSASDGIFIVPELEGLAGLPEIRTTSGVNAGYDGGWTSAQNYDARLISIRGVIANNNIAQVEALRRKLASLLGQGRKESLTLKFVTEAGNAYSIAVRTISCEMALQRVLNKQDFLIQLRADDPLIYDDGASGGTEAILHVQQTLGGFEINFELPLAIGGGAEDTIIENGDEAVYPVINLYGPLHSPTVVNRTTNQQFQILADLGREPIYSNPISVSGNYINFEIEGEYGGAISDFKSLGNTEQTTYSGKNLISARPSSGSANGITWTLNSDGSVTVSGTATANQVISFGTVSMTQGQTYTLSGCPSGGAVGKYILYTNVVDPQFIDTGSGATHAVSATATAQVNFIIYNGRTINGTIYPMLEIGSSASPYEPYVGGTASPNPDYPQAIDVVTGEQTVKITGKNLLNITSATGYTYSAGLPDATSSAITVNDFDSNMIDFTIPNSGSYLMVMTNTFKLKPNTEYAISFNRQTTLINNQTFVYGVDNGTYSILYRDNNGGALSATFTSPSNGLICIAFGSGLASGSATISDIQIEEGSATAYEPYQGQSYTIDLGSIELCKIGTYQDYIWNDNGTWKVHKETGKASISISGYTTTYTNIDYATFAKPSDMLNYGTYAQVDAICESAISPEVSGGYDTTAQLGRLCTGASRYVFWVGVEKGTTQATAETLLNGKALYYALATPTDTEITNSTLIAQLEAVASASLYSGQNNISNSSVSPNLAGDMEIEYREIDGYDVDLAVIDSQNRTVTLNGQDIYHLKTEESEFLMLAPGENKLYLTSATSDDQGYAEVKFKQGYLSI